MKLCKRCGIEKDEGYFYKGAGMKCKDCTKSDVRENLKNIGDTYDKTEKGVIRVIYKTQKRHNKLRGHGEMPYSKAELSSWLYSNGFKKLYDEWVSSGYLSDLKPSVDRINNFIGYSFYLNFQFTYIIWYGIPSNADAKLATIKIKRFAICIHKLFFHTFRHVNPFKNLAICS